MSAIFGVVVVGRGGGRQKEGLQRLTETVCFATVKM